MKPYYSDFVRHCIKYYVAYPEPSFKTAAEKLNWNACNRVISKLPETNQTIIKRFYLNDSGAADKIKRLSDDYNIPAERLWRFLNKLENRIASARGLI